MLQNINRDIILTITVLIGTILLFAFSNLDILIQDNFYNFKTGQWILDKHEPILKFIFYDGIKGLLILFIVLLLMGLIFFRERKIIQEYKKGIIIVILSTIIIPLVVGGLKKCTNMPCPKNSVHYGGIYPETKIWEQYPKEFKQNKRSKCWPAGHASGGFALLSLFFLFKTKKAKTKAVVFGMAVGWSMGIYKMLIGDHFLSHTIVTMLLAWLIILITGMAGAWYSHWPQQKMKLHDFK